MRPRKIFALLDGELLKQKLQTKNYQIIEKQINIFIYLSYCKRWSTIIHNTTFYIFKKTF